MKKMTLALACVFTMISSIGLAVENQKPYAKIGSDVITEEQVLDKVFENVMNTMKGDKKFDLIQNSLDELIDNRLLEAEAKAKKVTVEKLMQDVATKTTPVTDEEAKRYYDANQRRYGGKSFEEAKPVVIGQLTMRNRSKAYDTYLETLRQKAGVQVLWERPRVTVSTDDDPSKGPKNAPVTIIEFTEYQCPFCRKARPVVNQILATYGDKVHYVLRDFPLNFHKQAKDAANAAQCAGEQGKYWEFSDKLWDKQGNHTQEVFAEIADDIGLDEDKFATCATSKKYYAEIQKDASAGAEAGVSGTPAYFINGVFVSGAQPFENFKQIIDAELKAKKK